MSGAPPTASPAITADCDRGGRALRLPACRRFRERVRRDKASGRGPTAGRRDGESGPRRSLPAPGRANKVLVYLYLQTLVGLLASVVLLGEGLGTAKVAGAAVILPGVYLARRA
jgi:hypothetical protein